MSSEVEVKVRIASKNCNLVKSIKASLSPDNLITPSNMRLDEVFESRETNECMYEINILVRGDLAYSLKRARSTVDEVLAIVKMLQKSLIIISGSPLEKS